MSKKKQKRAGSRRKNSFPLVPVLVGVAVLYLLTRDRAPVKPTPTQPGDTVDAMPPLPGSVAGRAPWKQRIVQSVPLYL